MEKSGVCQVLNVCLRHKAKYLDRYVNLRKYCADLFNEHKVKVRVRLRVIKKEFARKINKKTVEKLCRHCYAEADAENMEKSTDNEDEPYQPPPTNETLNKSLELLGCSPLKSISQRLRCLRKEEVSGINSCYSRSNRITQSTYVIHWQPSKRKLLQRIKGSQRVYDSFKEKKSSHLHLKMNKSVFWQRYHQVGQLKTLQTFLE